MTPSTPHLRIALTADIHYGPRHPTGRLTTLELVAHLWEHPPDILILAGDLGAGDEIPKCLDLFATLPGIKAVIPGNHDIWVTSTDERGNSLTVYQDWLPKLCRERGFHYLDDGALFLPEADLAIVGSMNWYDYSWASDELCQQLPDADARLQSKRFPRGGRHNDANFVRWSFSDKSFTDFVVEKMIRQLDAALEEVSQAIVVTHHPALRGLLYPAEEPFSHEALMWRAFSGNTKLEQALLERAEFVPFVFSGHTHWARECEMEGIRGFNIGGDYHFKRLLELDWPSGVVTPVEFHLETAEVSQ